jgi:hypothetical protein
MPIVPDAFRCALALGVECDALGPEQAEYLSMLLSIARDDGAPLQLFLPAAALATSACVVLEASAPDHAVDLLLPVGSVSDTSDVRRLGQEGIAAFRERCGHVPAGLRLGDMRRNGLHADEAAQQSLQDLGLRYVSSDYSTKVPDNPRNIGFADKNAAMLMKHQQPRRYANGLLEIPSPGYSASSFFSEQGRPLDEWIAHLQQCVDFAHDMGGLLYAPRLSLATLAHHDPDCRSTHLLLEYAASKKWGDVRFCTYREVWEWANAAP